MQLTTIDPDSTTTTYYTTDGTDPQTSGSRKIYNIFSISFNSNTVLRFSALDTAGNWSPNYTQTYTLDTIAPTATVNPLGGLFNTAEIVTLSMSEPGTIY